MEADWSVALAGDDPVVVVPWAASVKEGGYHFVDLRQDLRLVNTIAEANASTVLRDALVALNSAESTLWTAKCDLWSSDDPRDPYEMDADAGHTAFAAGSYIDIVARDADFRQSFARQEQWLRQVTEELRSLNAKAARVDLILRAAEFHGQPGFAVSWFVEGCGGSAEAAEQRWSSALALSLPVILDSLEADTGERYNGFAGE